MEGALTILAWNIRHGGGPLRTPEIGLALVEHRPDVVVLTEFRAHRGGQLRPQLADAGLEHHLSVAPDGVNGVLIASRVPLTPRTDLAAPARAGRWLAVDVGGFTLGAVHVPDDTLPTQKAAYWQFLVSLARRGAGERVLLIGDFNTARRGLDTDGVGAGCEALLGTLTTLGYVDAWRSRNPGVREDTWSDGRAACRLDAAFASPALAGDVLGARHLHGWREAGLSDHSALEVTVRRGPTPDAPRTGGLFGA